MELYAVFSSPQTYTVQTDSGQPLGSLNQSFVDRLVDGVSCFAGGRINTTLRYALEAVTTSWKVIPDNYMVRIRREDIHRKDLESALDRIRKREFWDDADL